MDTIKYEILEDGTVTITTDAIGRQNHHSADQLLKELAKTLGGPVDVKRRRKHAHVHAHGQQRLEH